MHRQVAQLHRAQAGWNNKGKLRPPFAETPRDGQESVWDYPRPPRIVPDRRRILVRLGDQPIADTIGAVRILETASPPTLYLPPADVRTDLLARADGASMCEWKGRATYWNVVLPDTRRARAAWSYEDPFGTFALIEGWFAFYPALLDCTVDDVPVRPQPGGFYGGWVTPEIVGPYKGEDGTHGW